MTTYDASEFDQTRQMEAQSETPQAAAQPRPQSQEILALPAAEAHADEARTDVLYVPLAVSVGDGFKFGCGFFMAFVILLLVAFVLSAALFALASLLGLSLAAGR